MVEQLVCRGAASVCRGAASVCRGVVGIPSIVIGYSQGSPYSANGVLASAATTSRPKENLENTKTIEWCL